MSTKAQRRLANLDELLVDLQALKHELAEKYAIQSLGLFGSFVRGEADEESDLDILVEFSSPPTLFEFVRLQNELSERLGLQVDLVMKSALKSRIGAFILEEVITL